MTLLYSVLRRAQNDAERLEALRVASPEDLHALYAGLIYRRLIAECTAATLQENASFAAFSAALEAAPSDPERVELIDSAKAEHGAEWLARWVQSRSRTTEQHIRAYRETIDAVA